ncbi:MAG: 16S rRNA (cytosine(1402)-N(4))-methyltransferase RsmH [Rickettsiales bacterium]|jgi:16S rRNA (cytosine1402-N4)-methyltransferase|nr:16S rRNA (cytosine(1402)-N(4))-methyltransferase RsmH [Rickettsiales bacterium]
MKHIPVMLGQVLEALGDIKGKTIVDATFGAGGYSEAFLERGATVVAFDRDPTVSEVAGVRLIRAPFSEIDKAGVKPDAIVFDLGVSSMQLDEPERGFSHRLDGPLDMRMSREGESAADFINSASKDMLIKIMQRFGEEPKAKFIAEEIILARPLSTTGQLKAAIERGSYDPKSAQRTFQAFRIYVNDELDEIETALGKASVMLKPGGTLAVVSFHSLEDRLVKDFMRSLTEAKGDPRLPAVDTPEFVSVVRGDAASDSEVAANPRARSARLRAIRKIN